MFGKNSFPRSVLNFWIPCSLANVKQSVFVCQWQNFFNMTSKCLFRSEAILQKIEMLKFSQLQSRLRLFFSEWKPIISLFFCYPSTTFNLTTAPLLTQPNNLFLLSSFFTVMCLTKIHIYTNCSIISLATVAEGDPKTIFRKLSIMSGVKLRRCHSFPRVSSLTPAQILLYAEC